MRGHSFIWHGSGGRFLAAQLRAIAGARVSVRLETYIFSESDVGGRFVRALTDAARRGVAVELLVDSLGSMGTSEGYFGPILAAGGRFRWFNHFFSRRWVLRDHRKLLVVDDAVAFVGGCNVADEYEGDGIAVGWRDGGVEVTGPVAPVLAAEFARQWRRAGLAGWRNARGGYAKVAGPDAEVTALFIKPGPGVSPLRSYLRRDLETAREIAVTAGYFLPTGGLRRQLVRAVRRGARLRVLLAGRSDVPLMALATQSMYRGLIRSGVEVHEYLPQILHAKVMVLDDVVYVGSSNLDPRSLLINFELMLRIRDAALADRLRQQFEDDLAHSRPVELEHLRRGLSWWERFKQRMARLVVARLDPWLALERLRPGRR
jgi:cardiolipin synthase